MQLADGLGVLLVAGGGTAFALGESALSRAEDLGALYWLAVGVVAFYAAVQMVRPGARG